MNKTFKKNFFSHKLLVTLISSIIMGSIVGFLMGENAIIFQPIINAIYTLTVPLIFIFISSTTANFDIVKFINILLYSLLILSIIGAIVILITFFVIELFPTVNYTDFKFFSPLFKLINKDFYEFVFTKDRLLAILSSIAFGISLRFIKEAISELDTLGTLAEAFLKTIRFLIYFITSIGVSAYFAIVVGVFSKEFTSYARIILLHYRCTRFIFPCTFFPRDSPSIVEKKDVKEYKKK